MFDKNLDTINIKSLKMKCNTINYYEESASSLIDRYELANVSEVQKLLLNTFKQNSKLLEIGCGSGRDASFLTNHSYNVLAIDGSSNMIKEAKQIHPELEEKLFHKVLPNDLEFDKEFEGIYSIATLMHLLKNDLKQTLLKIYGLLNRNGNFLMSVSLLRNDINENGFDKNGRFFLILSSEEWINICEEVGFKIVMTKTNHDGLNRDGIEWLTVVASK